MRIALLAIGITVSSLVSAAEPEPLAFDGAKWIWHPTGQLEPSSLPAGVTFFRAEIPLSEDVRVETAQIAITVDNLFALWVNGNGVGECEVDNSAWGKPRLGIAPH